MTAAVTAAGQPSRPTLRALAGPLLPALGGIVAVLWGLGALLGLVWSWWSPPGPAGFVIRPGVIQPDETEAFVAGDGRFAVLVLVTGLAAGLIVWFARLPRGTLTALALAVGGLGGAALTELVGRWAGGGSTAGKAGSVIAHLPLSLHMTGLRYLEPAAALFVYGLFASFTVHDDLGRPDPVRDAVRSVRVDEQLQDAGGDRDRPGGPQQGDLAPQQHRGPA